MQLDNLADNTEALVADPLFSSGGSKQGLHSAFRFYDFSRTITTSLVSRHSPLPVDITDASLQDEAEKNTNLSIPNKLNYDSGITPVDGNVGQSVSHNQIPQLSQNNDDQVEQTTGISHLPKIHRSQLVPSQMKADLQATFKSTKKWEGMIVDIVDDSFSARLVSSDTAVEDEYTTFTFEEIDPADHELIIPGAIFYWNIGYTINSVGTKTRDSIIIFRRSPRCSRSDRLKREEDSKKIFRCFDDIARA